LPPQRMGQHAVLRRRCSTPRIASVQPARPTRSQRPMSAFVIIQIGVGADGTDRR
jgi:hypothetical protein